MAIKFVPGQRSGFLSKSGLSPIARKQTSMVISRSGRLAVTLSMIIAMNGNAQSPESDAGCPTLVASAANVSIDQPKPTTIPVELMRACEISFQELQTASRTIVDIRDSNAHARLSLRGALNLPLSSLRHRDFLKPQAIVLVDEGKSPSMLMRACAELRTRGFQDVRVLTGGLRTMHAYGAPLDADARSIQGLYQLTPSEFDSETGRPGWLNVGAGIDEVTSRKDDITLHESLSTGPGAKPLSTQLHLMLEKYPGNVLIVIGASDSFPREPVETLSAAEKARVVTLVGGLPARERYQARQAGIVSQAGKALVRACTEM